VKGTINGEPQYAADPASVVGISARPARFLWKQALPEGRRHRHRSSRAARSM
jgi:hypothetical protein